jgi:hypothetical protein
MGIPTGKAFGGIDFASVDLIIIHRIPGENSLSVMDLLVGRDPAMDDWMRCGSNIPEYFFYQIQNSLGGVLFCIGMAPSVVSRVRNGNIALLPSGNIPFRASDKI